MTTITAVSSTEVIVKNNGRVVRIPVANLVNVDETVASCARTAVKFIGEEVNVPSKQPRGCTPRNYAYAGIIQ